jgi:hypothetical protein
MSLSLSILIHKMGSETRLGHRGVVEMKCEEGIDSKMLSLLSQVLVAHTCNPSYLGG